MIRAVPAAGAPNRCTLATVPGLGPGGSFDRETNPAKGRPKNNKPGAFSRLACLFTRCDDASVRGRHLVLKRSGRIWAGIEGSYSRLARLDENGEMIRAPGLPVSKTAPATAPSTARGRGESEPRGSGLRWTGAARTLRPVGPFRSTIFGPQSSRSVRCRAAAVLDRRRRVGSTRLLRAGRVPSLETASLGCLFGTIHPVEVLALFIVAHERGGLPRTIPAAGITAASRHIGAVFCSPIRRFKIIQKKKSISQSIKIY